MPTKPKIFGFAEEDARVLADFARKKGLTPSNEIYTQGFDMRAKGRRYLAKTGDTAITARVGATPGSGTVTIQRVNPFSGDIEAFKDENGDPVTLTAYSWVASASGTNAYVFVGFDTFGTLWYENEDCS